MAGLFSQYLAIYNNENLPNEIDIAKVGSRYCQWKNKPFYIGKILPLWWNFAKFGHTGLAFLKTFSAPRQRSRNVSQLFVFLFRSWKIKNDDHGRAEATTKLTSGFRRPKLLRTLSLSLSLTHSISLALSHPHTHHLYLSLSFAYIP